MNEFGLIALEEKNTSSWESSGPPIIKARYFKAAFSKISPSILEKTIRKYEKHVKGLMENLGINKLGSLLDTLQRPLVEDRRKSLY
ncbi:hypothetical protein DM860_003546 [Cuscuta australis]|uniref:Uncharacterized protein n=1 Tax=Cuscuta australis TaxID=267555 RepID=A0A328DGE4_9ASTE|nr:hypothetical protein DM860_003546 [Cuscuta australis]